VTAAASAAAAAPAPPQPHFPLPPSSLQVWQRPGRLAMPACLVPQSSHRPAAQLHHIRPGCLAALHLCTTYEYDSDRFNATAARTPLPAVPPPPRLVPGDISFATLASFCTSYRQLRRGPGVEGRRRRHLEQFISANVDRASGSAYDIFRLLLPDVRKICCCCCCCCCCCGHGEAGDRCSLPHTC
jgi:hypothetical protein